VVNAFHQQCLFHPSPTASYLLNHTISSKAAASPGDASINWKQNQPAAFAEPCRGFSCVPGEKKK